MAWNLTCLDIDNFWWSRKFCDKRTHRDCRSIIYDDPCQKKKKIYFITLLF